MGFSEKIRAYFKENNLTQREVSSIMDGYPENMISKHLSSKNISATFLEKLIQYFPDLDFNYLLKDDQHLSEIQKKEQQTKEEVQKLIVDIEVKLMLLKEKTAQ
jgi:hypothetical protein